MKIKNSRTILSLMVLLFSFALVACGENDQANNGSGDKLEDIKAAGELTIGTSPDYPPLEFYVLDENGDRQIAGSDIALAQAIADEIGVDLNIRATDFNGDIANVESSSVDMGISGFTFTEQRADVMDVSEGYLQESTLGYQSLMMQKDMAEKFDALVEIEEANLIDGAQGGSIQFELAANLTEEANIKQYG